MKIATTLIGFGGLLMVLIGLYRVLSLNEFLVGVGTVLFLLILPDIVSIVLTGEL